MTRIEGIFRRIGKDEPIKTNGQAYQSKSAPQLEGISAGLGAAKCHKTVDNRNPGSSGLFIRLTL